MSRRDERGMPPLASLAVDQKGADLVGHWIGALKACP
jgi:hypothetical protein